MPDTPEPIPNHQRAKDGIKQAGRISGNTMWPRLAYALGKAVVHGLLAIADSTDRLALTQDDLSREIARIRHQLQESM